MPIRHIVMWNYREGGTDEQNHRNARKMKEGLEALVETVPGIIRLEVIIDACSTSNRDVVLNSLFVSEKALAEYQVHPEHVIISNYIGTIMRNRTCIDYYEEGLSDGLPRQEQR